ncbi:glycosyltransferase family 2 protein [Bacillus cereus group sp. BfR-BA-01383]|uniref:glycosyltransferase n=1 Tax=Bacillus cereus group sp. BfR-BA-01383 TaxID=2920327 RepID=UPI001F592434|nr:glycosyltransferase family 2 protein [Bacillus cereus group sp. BfR-BA-01383]
MVSIITCTMREEFMDNVFANYERQIGEDKELIIILNRGTMDFKRWEEKASGYRNVNIYQLGEEYTLGDCLNFAIDQSKYDYIAKFDDDDYYGAAYIIRSIEGFKKPDVSIVGKNSFYMYIKSKRALILANDKEHTYTDWVAGATLVVKKEVFSKVKFRSRNIAEDAFFIADCKLYGFKMYSTDRFDFTALRRDPNEHTWQVSDEVLLNWGQLVAYTDDFESIVSTNA